ncbi:MAG: InlB B-repeat-containing protein [Limisphaerales bacterium]
MSRFALVRWAGFCAAFAVFGAGVAAAQPQSPSPPREFPVGALERLSDLPAGRFRADLERLPAPARERALGWLRGFHFTTQDLPSLQVDAEGGICYACSFTRPAVTEPSSGDEPPTVAAAEVPISPFPAHLIFHSRPGAPNVLFLEFSGMTVTNSAWTNEVGRTSIPALPFSTDGNFNTFNDAEQAAIKRIWQRMAEDYAPFNINVTTERPAVINNRTAIALITRSTDANGQPNPYSSSGGVAYVNVFNLSNYGYYRPAWVYHNNLGNDESYIAEAASHEVGHNLGLSHDGRTDGMEYYGGHGSGEISWGPIMGTGYNRNVSQWSRGDYYLANNTQDDLAIIAGKIAYRADDHGNTAATATAMVLSGGTNIVATTPENDPANTNTANKGVLSPATDVDVFSFVTGSGAVRLQVNPWVQPVGTRGGNLDLLIELYDANGVRLATNNPATQTGALIQTNLTAGVYYLHVRNSGAGDPFSSSPSGYTSYGSLGQYFLSGFVTDPAGLVIPPVAELSAADLTEPGQTMQQFTVTYSDNVAINVATLDGNDLRVTGPNGYDQLAQLVAVNNPGNGTPRVATYGLTPAAGGFWSPADNGTYTVFMRSNQVADTEGAFVAAGPLGQFNVAVPLVVYSANMNQNPGWTLEPDWQYGTPSYGGSGPAGGYTGTQIVGYNLSGTYPNGLSARYATTPVINTAGTSSLTVRFRRWLAVRDIDSALIQVSTNGVHWLTVWSSSGNISDGSWQLAQHPLPAGVAGSTTVQLRWALSSGGSGGRPTRIGWNIDDVELLATGALDANPPVASLSVANLTQGGSPSHACSVTYTDATAVRLASLSSGNLLVTGPGGYSNLCEFIGADLADDGSPMTGTYAIPAPGGLWDAADNGTYTITLLGGTVSDIWNNSVPQTALGSFEVAISAATPGVLAVLPADGLTATGAVGGPFTPAALTYTLTNAGGATLHWTASKAADWLDLSAVGGSLATGATATVTVSLNGAAAALPAGNYSDTILFANTSTGLGTTMREVALTVTSAPPATAELFLSVNHPGWGSVAPANGPYPVGTLLELLAQPADYFTFVAWTGDVTGTSNPVSLVLESNVTAQAEFAELFTTNRPTPLWWLAENGVTNDFENAVEFVGANGYALWQSYVAGLNPADPASQLRLDAAPGASAGEWVLTWNPVAGRLYTLTVATNEPGPFAPLPDATDLPASVSAYTNQLNAADSARFFRLQVRRP